MKDIEQFRLKRPDNKVSLELASLLFFDIETTGLYPERGAKITEIALLSRSETILSWTSNSQESGKQDLSEVLPELVELLSGGVIVGHNVKFDLKFIAYEIERNKNSGFSVRFIDTMDLSRKFVKQISDFQLGTLLNKFDIKINGKLHSALVDAKATRALFWKLIETGNISRLSETGMKQLNW